MEKADKPITDVSKERVVLNWERLNQCFFGNAKLVDLVLVKYLSAGDDHRDRLRAAVAAADIDTIRFEAHAFKGSSLSLGADILADCCKALERAALDGSGADASDQLNLIESAYETVREEILLHLSEAAQDSEKAGLTT